ncbi:MAG: hypothetical protein IJ367_02040 [Clostridia bacterium]|nr:hypothetical protein [Clostridia bacterium]
MIKVLIGPKGTGKSKTLISWVAEAVENEHGNVVCIVKDDRYNLSISRDARLINASDFEINGAGELYGFLCGLISMNYDVTHIFIDSLTSIMKTDVAAVDNAIPYLEKLSQQFNIKFTIMVSGEEAEAKDLTKKYIVK